MAWCIVRSYGESPEVYALTTLLVEEVRRVVRWLPDEPDWWTEMLEPVVVWTAGGAPPDPFLFPRNPVPPGKALRSVYGAIHGALGALREMCGDLRHGAPWHGADCVSIAVEQLASACAFAEEAAVRPQGYELEIGVWVSVRSRELLHMSRRIHGRFPTVPPWPE